MSRSDTGAHFDSELAGVLADVVETLHRAGIGYALIGGIASSILGRPRSTRDIDVFVRPANAHLALEALAAHKSFATDKLDEQWLFKAFKHSVTVDVIFCTRYGLYFDAEVAAHVRTASYLEVPVCVVAPEDLAMMKAISTDEATPRHWYDALALLRHPEFDWDYFVHRARFGLRRAFSLLSYAQSIDYFVPQHALATLIQLMESSSGPADRQICA